MIESLNSEILQLENESQDLKAKIEAIQRKEERERETLKRKQAEEVQFLKVKLNYYNYYFFFTYRGGGFKGTTNGVL